MSNKTKELKSARLKVARGRQHLDDLEHKIFDFAGRAFHFPAVLNSEGVVVYEVVIEEPIPLTFTLCIGDIIHNLRSALDHAIYENLGKDFDVYSFLLVQR